MSPKAQRRPKVSRDSELSLPAAEADKLRRLVEGELGQRSINADVSGDHVEFPDGQVYGLSKVASQVSFAPSSMWPEIVSAHFEPILDEGPELEQLSVPDLLTAVHIRLVSNTAFPQVSQWPHAFPVTDDLFKTMCFDLPKELVTPDHEFFAARGGIEQFTETAWANLYAVLRRKDLKSSTYHIPEGGEFDVVYSQSWFTASLSLLLAETMAYTRKQHRSPAGTLVAVPTRHHLAWAPVEGPEILQSLNYLAAYAYQCYRDGPGSLTPTLYWVRGDEWRPVSSVVDGRPHIELASDLQREITIGLRS